MKFTLLAITLAISAVSALAPINAIAEENSNKLLFNQFQQNRLRINDLLNQIETLYLELQEEKKSNKQRQKVLEERINGLEKMIASGVVVESNDSSTEIAKPLLPKLTDSTGTSSQIDSIKNSTNTFKEPNPLELLLADEEKAKIGDDPSLDEMPHVSLLSGRQSEEGFPDQSTIIDWNIEATDDEEVDEEVNDADIDLIFLRKQQEAEYDVVFEFLLNREYALAIYGFKRYLKKYPNSLFSPQAAYWLAEAYYVQGQYQTSLEGYEFVLATYPDSDRIDESLFKKGMSLLELRRIDEAKVIFNQVVFEYQDTTVATLAQNELDKLL